MADPNNGITTRSKGTIHILRIDTEVKGPETYRDHLKEIREAAPEDEVIVQVNTNGGELWTAMELHNALQDCSCPTTSEVYTAISAGSIIALSCDTVKVARHATMMIHNLAFGISQTIDHVADQTDYIKAYDRAIFEDIYQGFLTPQEIEETIRGRDLWLNSSAIQARLITWTNPRRRRPL